MLRPAGKAAKVWNLVECPLQWRLMLHTSDASAIVEFGRFRVEPHRREILADGQPIKLGGRAFDLLIALIEASGAVVSKDVLLDRVWPGRIVEENRLQNQVSALRKAFGADHDLIRTVAGRGYQFTGQIRARSADSAVRSVRAVPPGVPAASDSPTNLPGRVSELIGRDAEVGEILHLLAEHRLLTLTGVGGIGKTTLGFEVARHLLPEFADGIWVAELGPLSGPDLVFVTVAAALGLELTAGATSPERVANALGSKRLLLVLDNCEHVINAAASMAEALSRANPWARMMATSREPLRVSGECIYRVLPLGVPAEGAEDPDEVLRHGAARLFVARARDADPHFSLDSRAAAAIAAICRRLDGMPLAIELAAARTASLGLEGLASRLDDRFMLLTGGRRTALPRQQTLRATLDWSYELLSEPERAVLRRLAVFPGGFTLEAASTVVASAEIAASDGVDHVPDLVEKSLVVADGAGATVNYRLLETTRAYALDKLAQSRRVRTGGAAPRRIPPGSARAGRDRVGNAACGRMAGRLWAAHRRCPHRTGLGLFANRRHVGRGRARRRLGGPVGTVVAAGGMSPARRPSARQPCAWINLGGAPRNAPLWGTWGVAVVYQRSRARDRRSLGNRIGNCGEAWRH